MTARSETTTADKSEGHGSAVPLGLVSQNSLSSRRSGANLRERRMQFIGAECLALRSLALRSVLRLRQQIHGAAIEQQPIANPRDYVDDPERKGSEHFHLQSLYLEKSDARSYHNDKENQR